jgi:hypothetical protein
LTNKRLCLFERREGGDEAAWIARCDRYRRLSVRHDGDPKWEHSCRHRKRVQRLMQVMGIEALYPKRRTTVRDCSSICRINHRFSSLSHAGS